MYPRGREGRDGTYFSVYFGLVPGVNDEELQWPFLNRHVRVQMEDQDADVRISMNQFYQYLTESDQGDGTLWDKPTEGVSFACDEYIVEVGSIDISKDQTVRL